MATLISPIDITLSRKFPTKSGLVLKTFDFKKGVAVPDIPDEYANALKLTYPDRYFTPKEWENRDKIIEEAKEELKHQIGDGEKVKFPTLEELQSKGLGDLKAIADDMNVRYGPTISPKTLATRIFEQIKPLIELTGDGEAEPKTSEDLEENTDSESVIDGELKEKDTEEPTSPDS